ncbi:hypothetical protein J5N97_026567 [Dioscorea zingiberensis]|uniref:Uncharacterized protein n=1 Tax=Dioscorea zingiberensis TaxID=325984 RepID=A0A9D5C3J9_9LILI|nr:hypothetical protein J5N97_026567 [Dioscorea zingiberensis]
MPGPGPHTMYALGTGVGLMRVTRGAFSPHHCLFYATNAFLGPDLGSFSEWLTSSALGLGQGFGSLAMEFVHHPFYYPLLLGLPLALFYSWLSGTLLRGGILDTLSGVPLSRWQCLLLVCAGSLSHFFLDHLFEENGHSSTYTWILSTGWWKDEAPINPDAVIVVGFLCTCLFGVKHGSSIITKSGQSMRLILVIGSLYCLWCTTIGEEADLGVLIFLAVYFFLPHGLCIFSINQKYHPDTSDQLPL